MSTDACVDHYYRELAYIYREWLLRHVFKAWTIVVLPLDEGKPNYRDAPPP